MVHCGSIRQTASIIRMSADCLRTGDKARVKFKFVKHPEYLQEGQRLVFREGRTKAVGNVTLVIPHNPIGIKADKGGGGGGGNATSGGGLHPDKATAKAARAEQRNRHTAKDTNSIAAPSATPAT